MKSGVMVRLKYQEMGLEKKYSTWVLTKENLVRRLIELDIPIDTITELWIRTIEDKEYKSYDPILLQKVLEGERE